MGWPCKYWGSPTHLNFRTPQGKQRLRRLRRQERPLLELFYKVAAFQADHDGYFLGENPKM
eukprot:12494551-Alexandrium_andersonii.AAC.1